MSMPNASASIGTMTTPPPSPVSAPRKPARIDPPKTSDVNWKTFTANTGSCYGRLGCGPAAAGRIRSGGSGYEQIEPKGQLEQVDGRRQVLEICETSFAGSLTGNSHWQRVAMARPRSYCEFRSRPFVAASDATGCMHRASSSGIVAAPRCNGNRNPQHPVASELPAPLHFYSLFRFGDSHRWRPSTR